MEEITLDELIDYVAQEEDMCCHCTAKALTRAISYLQEKNLALVIEREGKDDE